MRGAWLAALSLAAAAVSCDPRQVDLDGPRSHDGGSRGEAIPGLEGLRITPDEREATFDGTRLRSEPVFHAYGKFANGKERDVSAEVEWTLARAELGSIAGGRFESAGVGGSTEVRARAGEFSDTATLRIQLEVVIDRDALRSAFTRDSADVPGASAPRLVYPGAGTVVPSNLTRLNYQWRAPEALTAFELRIDSDDAQLRYYTRDRNWLDDAETSRYLAPSHPGARVRIRVRGISEAAPGSVYTSEEITLDVAAASLPRTALYWSSTARGIKRGDFESGHATRVVTAPGSATAGTCTGCHVVSRDGKLLAVADETERLRLFSAPDWQPRAFVEPTMPAEPPGMMPRTNKGKMPMAGAPTPPPMATGMMPPMPEPMRGPPDYGFGSFSPDGTRLAYAAKGKLRIIDTETGKEKPKLRSPPDTIIAHPDWSPDGVFIAVAYANGKAPKSEKVVQGTSIGQLVAPPPDATDDFMLETPQPLVTSARPDDTHAFPAYSPDGRWIAFVSAVGGSKDNPTAQLSIVAANGSSAPLKIELGAPTSAANDMPTWGATTRESLAFLTFSSTRDYGDVLSGVRRDQLWATAIDLERLAAGVDPSAPAFWLPFQDPTEHNHRAFWIDAASGDDCDELCCRLALEDCNDDVDNDCDGVVNEGCGCAVEDTCGDDADNDCDQRVDEDCKP